jgi:DNA-binding transcriptional ArsR family regulator
MFAEEFVITMDIWQSQILNEVQAKKQADFCQVFSNPTRVLIFWALEKHELSVGSIAAAVGSSIQNVSQHLSKMKEHHLVRSRREGQTIYYQIDHEILENHCANLLNKVSVPWEKVDS